MLGRIYFIVPLIMACVFMVVDVSQAGDRKARKEKSETGLAELLHDVRQEGRKVCMEEHTHYGSSIENFSKKVSIAEAINSWEKFTDIEYGSLWASFKTSGDNKVVCKQDKYKRWQCDAEGRPCRIGKMKKKARRKRR